jgi:hypothetical protein
MDPFLEDPRTWESVHTRLIAVMSELLSALVRPRYYVEVESTVYIISPDDLERSMVRPDLYLVRHGVDAQRAEARPISASIVVEPIYPLELRQHYLEVRNSRTEAVVTTIELLSPANKAPRADSRAAYLAKRAKLMASPAHWLEIDLLRAGERSEEVAVAGDYYALLKRSGSVTYEVWPIDLRDLLPTVAIPLTEPDTDVPLDLQTAFTLMYDRHAYADRIDYRKAPPRPLLVPADAT